MNPKRLKWFMQADTAINPFLCCAEGDGGEGDAGSGGGEGEGEGQGDGAAGTGDGDDKGAGGKGADDSLGARFKQKQADDDKKKSSVDKVDPPKEGQFDLAQVPEAYRGKDADETLGKVFGKLKEYETAAEARGKAPERAEDYPLKLDDKTAKFFNVESDPAIAEARKWALGKGMGTNEFQETFGGLLKHLADNGMVEEPIDIDAEVEKLGEDGPKLYGDAEGYIARQEAKLRDLSGDAKSRT